jgi:murein DD-endopeptidase MepM/ murein hydrolase activator NlpD
MVARGRRTRKKSALPLLPAPARRGNIGLVVVLVGLVIVNLYVFLWRDGTSVPDLHKKAYAGTMNGAALDPAAETATPVETGTTTADGIEEGPAEAAPIVIEGAVAKADTLGKLLKRSGLAVAETDEVLRALQPVFDFRTLREGQPFKIERGPDGKIAAFELVTSKVHTVRAVRGPSGEMIGVADKAATRIDVVELGGTIDSSLYASIKAAGEDTSLVAFFVDVFAYDLDFYNDTHPGDTFRVVVEKEYKDTELLRYGRILAAEYAGKAGTFRAFWWTAPGAKRGRYYDEKGASLERSLLKTPLKFHRISSKFDRKRMHPVLHQTRAHLGVDYAAPTGTPVWAAASGRISSRGAAGGAGNMVTIHHDNGLTTLYMHLSKFAAGQKVGDRVEAKTVIGYVGTTGLSTGPHLHFGVKQNGSYVDPLKLAPSRMGGVSKIERPAFNADVATLIARLSAIQVTAKPAANSTTTDEP